MKGPQLAAEEHSQCCWALGSSYYAAAKVLHDSGGTDTFRPSLFLLLHALELFLKAFLVSQGMTEKQLRAISHDLLACLRACQARGFSRYVDLSWREQLQIGRLNRYYQNKELEYFVPRAKHFGNVDQIFSAVLRISKRTFDLTSASNFRARAQGK